jgi:hypothetical protein
MEDRVEPIDIDELERGAARGRPKKEWIRDRESLVRRYVNDNAWDYAYRIEQNVIVVEIPAECLVETTALQCIHVLGRAEIGAAKCEGRRLEER